MNEVAIIHGGLSMRRGGIDHINTIFEILSFEQVQLNPKLKL